MTIFKIIVEILLVIVTVPTFIIGLKNIRKSNKLRKNVSDIEVWKISIISAQEYPEEYKRNKQNIFGFLLGYIIFIIGLAVFLAGMYTFISYRDNTVTITATLVEIVAVLLMFIFYPRALGKKLKIQNSLIKTSDPEIQEKLSEFININQLALKGVKYFLPSILFLFIVFWVSVVL